MRNNAIKAPTFIYILHTFMRRNAQCEATQCTKNARMIIKAVYNPHGYTRKDKLGMIYIYIAQGQDRKYLPIQERVNKNQWKDGRVIRHPDMLIINQIIDDYIYAAKTYVRSCIKEGHPASPKKIMDHISNKKPSSSSLIDFIVKRVNELDISMISKKKHKDLINKLKAYDDTIKTNEFDYTKLIDFEMFLKKARSQRGGVLHHNSIMAILTLLRGHIIEAKKQELTDVNPFDDYRMKKIASRHSAHTMQELLSIERADLSDLHKSYQEARYRYLFLCYTGIRYGDHMKINQSNLENKMIKFVAGKTARSKGKLARIPIDLFGGKAYQFWSLYNFQFSYYNNKSFNEAMRKICEKAGIKKYVTVHTARHTFKSLCIEKGIPLDIIAEMMAHSSVRTTERYGSISDEAISRYL